MESEDGLLKVNVGSGLSKQDLEDIKGNEDSYIGEINALLYNERIEDKHGNKSLFLPRIKELARKDKTIANLDSEID